jgi:hypothetical protein
VYRQFLRDVATREEFRSLSLFKRTTSSAKTSYLLACHSPNVKNDISYTVPFYLKYVWHQMDVKDLHLILKLPLSPLNLHIKENHVNTQSNEGTLLQELFVRYRFIKSN